MKNINYCKCGCGEIVQKNYKKGHGRRGKTNSEEHNKKIKEANKNRILSEKEIERLRSYNINRKHTEETKKKISDIAKEKGFGKWMIGKKASEKTIEKLKKSLTGRKVSDETRKKISKKNSGSKNGMFGKTHSDEYKEKLRQLAPELRKNTHTAESIEKMRKKLIGKKHTSETKRKMRLSKIDYILNKNGGICPMHNIRACEYFDKLSEEKNWNLQHALNGGEFYISKLGYFIDAYDKNKNIVVEYDEPRHYSVKGDLKEKDIKRQIEIIEELNCDFYRFSEKNEILYKIENNTQKI